MGFVFESECFGGSGSGFRGLWLFLKQLLVGGCWGEVLKRLRWVGLGCFCSGVFDQPGFGQELKRLFLERSGGSVQELLAL